MNFKPQTGPWGEYSGIVLAFTVRKDLKIGNSTVH